MYLSLSNYLATYLTTNLSTSHQKKLISLVPLSIYLSIDPSSILGPVYLAVVALPILLIYH